MFNLLILLMFRVVKGQPKDDSIALNSYDTKKFHNRED